MGPTLTIVIIVFLAYSIFSHIKLINRIKYLEDLNRNNCSKKNYYKNVVDNKGYTKVSAGQKHLITHELKRLKTKYSIKEIAEKLKVTPSMVSRLNHISTLNIKKNNANKYIKKLRKID